MSKIEIKSHSSHQAYCIICGSYKGWSIYGQDTYSSPQIAERHATKVRKAFNFKTMVVPCTAMIVLDNDKQLENKIWQEMKTKYIVRLNNVYMTEYDETTGYNQFGSKEKAKRFLNYQDALDATSDVVWGGTDKMPQIEKVCDD